MGCILLGDMKWLQQQDIEKCRKPSHKVWTLACPTRRAGCKRKAIVSETMNRHAMLIFSTHIRTSTLLLLLLSTSFSSISQVTSCVVIVVVVVFSLVSILLIPPMFFFCLSLLPSFSSHLLQHPNLAITQDSRYGPNSNYIECTF